MIKRLRNWILNLFVKERLYKARIVTDIPDNLDNKRIYIIENEGCNWQAVMICPCGCNKILHMNLMEEYYPSWKFTLLKKDIVSLRPSINRTIGCKSHFFVTNGKIIWA